MRPIPQLVGAATLSLVGRLRELPSIRRPRASTCACPASQPELALQRGSAFGTSRHSLVRRRRVLPETNRRRSLYPDGTARDNADGERTRKCHGSSATSPCARRGSPSRVAPRLGYTSCRRARGALHTVLVRRTPCSAAGVPSSDTWRRYSSLPRVRHHLHDRRKQDALLHDLGAEQPKVVGVTPEQVLAEDHLHLLNWSLGGKRCGL